MMRAAVEAVNRVRICGGLAYMPHEKKPGSKEPGLRYWPREADTITFQEGLPSSRATGGGGQCATRNLSDQTMIRVGALQQAPKPHVSHAEIAVSSV